MTHITRTNTTVVTHFTTRTNLTVDEIKNFNESINCRICSCLFIEETDKH